MMTKHFISLSLCGLALTAPIARAEIDSQQFEQAFTKFAQTPKGQETIAKAVEEFFKKRQEEARKQEEDRAAADIEEQFKNPVVIPVGNSPVKGPADAKITIIEFSDFQCPFCKRGKDTAEAVLKA